MRKITLVFLVAMLYLGISVAEQQPVAIELLQETFAAGGTLQAKITTTSLEKSIKPEQITLYLDGKKTPIAPFLTKYDDVTYFLYFDLPETAGEKPILAVEKILYKENNLLKEATMQKEIPITKEPASILTFLPGVMLLEKGQREIQLQVEHKKGDTVLNITASPSVKHSYTTPQTINTGSKRLLKFSIDQENLESNAVITIEHTNTSYKILVLKRAEVKPDIQPPDQQPSPTISLIFVAAKPDVNKTITRDMVLAGTLTLKNNGNLSVENITVSLAGNLPSVATIDTTFIPSLNAEQEQTIKLIINEQTNALPGIYEGFLQAAAGKTQAQFPIFILVEAKPQEQPLNKTTINLDLEQKQEPVGRDQDLKFNFTKQEPPRKEKEYPIGLIIITLMLILAAIAFVFLRKKKKVREESFEDYLQKIRK